jgi:hypothetical protein
MMIGINSLDLLLPGTGRRGYSMTIQGKVQPLVQITDPDFRTGFDEAQEPYYADCGIHTDMGLVEVVRSMLTEYAVEMGLSEQQLRRSTGFIIGILSRE